MNKLLTILSACLGLSCLSGCFSNSPADERIREENQGFPNYLQSSSERWDNRDWAEEDEGEEIGGDGF